MVVVGAWRLDERYVQAGEFQQYIKQTDVRIKQMERIQKNQEKWRLRDRISALLETQAKQRLTPHERRTLRDYQAELKDLEGGK